MGGNLNNNITNLQNQINNCIDLGEYNIMNGNTLLSNQNNVHLQYGIDIMPGYKHYNAQGGKGYVTRSHYISMVGLGVLVIKMMLVF